MAIFIDSQRLREPIFDGWYSINLGKDVSEIKRFSTVNELTIVQSTTTQSGNYKEYLYKYPKNWMVQPNSRAEMHYISLSNSHYMFPFDSASFNGTFF
jgi:hypothetical protein